MCGISGFVTVNPSDVQNGRSLVDRIVKSQHRRGPDFQSIELYDRTAMKVLLGHNRLSIIDLSAQSHQPMTDREDRVAISFNGEIYNYLEIREELTQQFGSRFRSSGDTEVILEAYKAWGIDMLGKLNGMFAFALFDFQNHTLYVVRDRFGVKPLVYYNDGQQLAFGSSAVEIARHYSCGPDTAYASRGLRYGIYDGFEDTAFKDINNVPAGSYLAVRPASAGGLEVRTERYYDLHEAVEARVSELADISEVEAAHEFLQLFTSAVNLRLRADVDVAVSLSGGLDSSTIAAVARERASGELRGYTMGNPDDARSEGPLVAELSKKIGIQSHYVDGDNSDVTQAFWDTFEAQEAPFGTLSLVAQNMVYQRTARDKIKVLLGGQGADEMLMGYRKFFVFYMQSLKHQGRYSETLGVALQLSRLLMSEVRKLPDYWASRKNYSKKDNVESVVNLPGVTPSDAIEMGHDVSRPLWERCARDILETSIPSLLRYEDRNSMYHSIESRLPFMDYRLVEFMIALPDALKIRHGYGKWILRKSVESMVPDSIRLARYKRGFDVPHGQWVEQGVGNTIRDALGSSNNLDDWVTSKVDIPNYFSNTRLQHQPSVFHEAVTLLWLSRNA